ncbi:YbdD/YjiX family protein [Sphingomonas quercus]|uniref:YbdD/YjiX family protein n=1 Tax=Sphingomonas quercus TaxID=2842451 RepID=A0ABS6BJU6_9SPHN|nr:YbdD/YjiX family protein [Sphingomonas quercus]MBU3078563.1 YbdD/YjiX family protein [Sphingomonas quercus]
MAELAHVLKLVRDGARLMVGVQSYEAYLTHMRAHHPDREPMTEVEFFENRMKAQYGEAGKGGFRCC